MPAVAATARILLECCERRPAPFRVAVGFTVIVASPSRSTEGDASLPEVGQQRKRIHVRLADDEPVGHVDDRGSGGKAERAGAGLRVRHPDRHVERRGPVVHLVQERAQVAGEVLERAARRYHVDEAVRRRAQLGVARRELHRLVVQRLHRVAGGRLKRIASSRPMSMISCSSMAVDETIRRL